MTADGVVATRPVVVDVTAECVSCSFRDAGPNRRDRNRIASRARRHAARTGHVAIVTTTSSVSYRAER